MTEDVLVIDNYDSFTRNLTALLTDAGGTFRVVPNDRLDDPGLDRYSRVLISPGPGVPSEAGGVEEFIRRRTGSAGILGVCLGHQAIAGVFGARLVRMPRPDHGERRRVRVVDRGSVLFRGLPAEFDAGLYHSWAVAADSLPDCLAVTALSDGGEIMAISHCSHDIHGVQFHPESVMTPEGNLIIRNWLGAPMG